MYISVLCASEMGSGEFSGKPLEAPGRPSVASTFLHPSLTGSPCPLPQSLEQAKETLQAHCFWKAVEASTRDPRPHPIYSFTPAPFQAPSPTWCPLPACFSRALIRLLTMATRGQWRSTAPMGLEARFLSQLGVGV